MAANSPVPWESLERRSQLAFILAGVFLLLNVVLNNLSAIAGTPAPEWTIDIVILSGSIAGLLGLLGLSPRLKSPSPRLTRAGNLIVALGALGILAIAIGKYVLEGEKPPVYLQPLQLFYIIGIPLSFLLFGAACVRTRVPSRSVGLSLLTVFVASLFFFHLIPLDVSGFLTSIPSLVFGVASLATGVLLRTKSRPVDQTDRSVPS